MKKIFCDFCGLEIEDINNVTLIDKGYNKTIMILRSPIPTSGSIKIDNGHEFKDICYSCLFKYILKSKGESNE